MKKAAVVLICCLSVFCLEPFKSGASVIIDSGNTEDFVNDKLTMGSQDQFGEIHYGFLFETSKDVKTTTLNLLSDTFTLSSSINCPQNHDSYAFITGSKASAVEKTSVNINGHSVTVDFFQTRGKDIVGLGFTNNSHDNLNPLHNNIAIEDLKINFDNGIYASGYAAGIYLMSKKQPDDIKGTTNSFTGNSLDIYVENNHRPVNNEKGYAVGILSQGDILTSDFHYEDTINIKTVTTEDRAASYGIYVPSANGKTDTDDIHILDVFAREININSVANETRQDFSYGAGIYISGNYPMVKNPGFGMTAIDVGIDRDWNSVDEGFEESIRNVAQKVKIHGSGSAVYAQYPNTWVSIGASEEISLSSDFKSVVVADSGARIVIYGNSYIEANGKKENANALYATNNYIWSIIYPNSQNNYDNPESRIRLFNGNHTIKGDIVALDGALISISKGRHSITGDIYALGNLLYKENTADFKTYDANVSIENKGGFFTGKADTFYKNKENIIARDNEKNFYLDDMEHGKISLAFSDGAVWNMTDRSLVTDLSLKGSSTVSVNYGRKSGDSGRGLFVENFDISEHNSGIFNMTLNGTDKTKSDMLYVLDGTADTNGKFSKNYVINLQNSDLSALMKGETIRYATVNGDDVKDALTQRVVSIGSGILNLEFETGAEKFDKNDSENKDYNGAEGSLTKPGNSLIVSEFDKDGSYNLFIQGIKRPDPTPDPTPDPDPDPDPGNPDPDPGDPDPTPNPDPDPDPGDPDPTPDPDPDPDPGNPDPDPGNPGPDPTPEPDPTPLPPIHTGLSRSVSAVFDMSYFSYIQIIQPDRLNKRVGDVFNLGSDDDGLWFRTTYDDLGITDITSQSYSLQGGYDKLYKNDDFSLRFGVSGRYTDTDIDFASSNANGKLSATQISVYGTYIGANDWFFDVTARYGFLSSKTNLVTESGFGYESQYDNEFQGLSLEAGKRFSLYADNVHQFYLAPQVSLSYLHIDDVNYITNQGSRIGISAIDSLISRVGAKLGYVYDNKMQAALKWDWFREWNGAQHFSMVDNTTFGIPVERGIEAETSWYDIGLTLQMNIKENIAVYADVEKLYGGLYEDSYRYSAGMRITF